MNARRFWTPTLWTLAAAAAALTLLGALHLPRRPELGYTLGDRGTVARIEPGGAAEAAGLEVGDQLLRIDGQPYRPDAMAAHTLRAGARRILEVERGEASVTVDLVVGSMRPMDRGFGLLFASSGLFLIAVGPWLYGRSGSRPALTLALAGIALGMSQGYRPLASTPLGHELLGFVYRAVAALCTPLLVRFALVFPRRRRAASSPLWQTLLFAPAAIQIVLQAVALVWPSTQAAMAPAVAVVTLGGQLYLLHVALWLGLLIAGYLQTDAAERRPRGVGVLFWGTLAALLPILVMGLVQVFAPGAGGSAAGLVFLPSAFLPLALAYAVWKSDRAEP